jgi:hypothetical protein
MISNARVALQGSGPLFLGAVNWTVGREKQLNAPPRPIERFELSLSAAELTNFAGACCIPRSIAIRISTSRKRWG